MAIGRIRKDGMEENVEVVRKTPRANQCIRIKIIFRNVKLLPNYLPALSTVLEPLHLLLRKGYDWKWEDCH